MKITHDQKIPGELRPNDHPYLNGAYTPLLEEVDANDLDVIEGAIPRELDGVYLRNTQNQVHEPVGRYHPFDGDGMLHVIGFRDGNAFYRNRFIRTDGFLAENEAGEPLWPGLASEASSATSSVLPPRPAGYRICGAKSAAQSRAMLRARRRAPATSPARAFRRRARWPATICS